METALSVLWQTSWQAALLAGIVWIITKIFRRWMSFAARQAMWLLVFARLCMPWLPRSPLSVLGLQWKHDAAPIPQTALQWRVVFTNHTSTIADHVAPLAQSSLHWLAWTIFAIWILGAAAVLGQVVLSTCRFAARLRRSGQPVHGSALLLVQECCRAAKIHPPLVLATDQVSSPSLFGVIHPRLLLPNNLLSTLDRAAFREIVLHEIEHLRKHHLLMEWFLSIVRAAHWFNPAAWWAHREIRAARELACDRAVMNRLDETSRQHYGLTLVNIAQRLSHSSCTTPTLGFFSHRRSLRERIEIIATFGRHRPVALLNWSLPLLLIAGCLTAPMKAQEPVAAAEPATQPSLVEISKPETVHSADQNFFAGPTTEAQQAIDSARRALSDSQHQAIASGILLDNQYNMQFVPERAPRIAMQMHLIELPADQAAEFLRDIMAEKMFLSGDAATKFLKQVLQIKGANLLTAPRVISDSGHSAQLSIGREDAPDIEIELISSASANRKDVNVEVSMSASIQRKDSKIADRWTISKNSMTVPDGQTCVFMQPTHRTVEMHSDGSEKNIDAPSSDRVVWLMMRPTLVAEQAAQP
jgi:bla regulator protein BlaR1